ncbi:Pycsar system effector family protein, partial [Streptomyces albidoflavus]|uniref:Pycsar system effector family protein n=1 Tax=Streptomyces albidoflavus TaxID=1886 RepID=UPI003440240B
TTSPSPDKPAVRTTASPIPEATRRSFAGQPLGTSGIFKVAVSDPMEDGCVTDTPSTPESEPPPNPDHAWKALSLVIDWIKHAETKAGATLAAAGVTGGVLYNLVKDVQGPSSWLIISAILCALAVLTTGLCAALVLWPRLRMKEDPTSLLYFHHIARGHATSDSYAASLLPLTSDIEALVSEIAKQSWANSKVAHTKYMWGGHAIRLLLLALAMLSLTAGFRVIN